MSDSKLQIQEAQNTKKNKYKNKKQKKSEKINTLLTENQRYQLSIKSNLFSETMQARREQTEIFK